MAYKLSSVLQGHELDVRAVCSAIFPEGAVITGSRDRTARVWIRSENGRDFTEGHVFGGHQNFISAVCTIPPSEKYPHGLVVTGGHDNVILIWVLDSVEPLFTLVGHTGAVSCLVAGKFGTLLSGSWDKTARVWLGGKAMMTLQGHEAAVWSVQLMPEHGLMLTGSADKTIKMWRAGACERTFTGHTDCVRGLSVLSQVEFVSCSNDCTIRRWMTTGECLQVYSGHTSFIYSVAAFSDESGNFVSAGEDRTLRIWKGGECSQVITQPAQSVWCVGCLDNGDVITGTSDGIARVFTCSEDREAAPEVLKHFEEEVASHAIPAQASGQLGDIKLEDLPGLEALLRPGDRSGQTKLIRRGNLTECHQWNSMEGKWDKVGEVVGAAGAEGSERSSGKSLYKGKEYDIVFNVEIEEGKPPLKLPFNLTDDPWMAAHNFLEQNNLSQMFLDQVVDFILKNTKGATIGQAAPSTGDPFTGGSRYVPGTGASSHSRSNQSQNGAADPFTGTGAYRPSYGSPTNSGGPTGGAADPFTGGSSYQPVQQGVPAPSSASSVPSTQNPFFPKTSYVTFDSSNAAAILGKLKEFNESLGEEAFIDKRASVNSSFVSKPNQYTLAVWDHLNNRFEWVVFYVDLSIVTEKLSDEEFVQLADLLTTVTSQGSSGEPSDKQLSSLAKALNWPTNVLFPVLDVLRLAMRQPWAGKRFCSDADGDSLVEQLLKCTRQDAPPANIVLVFRTFANIFCFERGCQLMQKYREKVVEQSDSWSKSPNKNIRIAVNTVFLNYAVLFHAHRDFEGKAQCLTVLSNILENEKDGEARFRALVATGTMLWEDQDATSLVQSLGMGNSLQSLCTVKDPAKVGECALQVLRVVKL